MQGQGLVFLSGCRGSKTGILKYQKSAFKGDVGFTFILLPIKHSPPHLWLAGKLNLHVDLQQTDSSLDKHLFMYFIWLNFDKLTAF